MKFKPGTGRTLFLKAGVPYLSLVNEKYMQKTLNAALERAKKITEIGGKAILTIEDENLYGNEQIKRVCAKYQTTIDHISTNKIEDISISLRLSQLGFSLQGYEERKKNTIANLTEILNGCKNNNMNCWIDCEKNDQILFISNMLPRLIEFYKFIGITLPTIYLKETYKMISDIISLNNGERPAIRLVNGFYKREIPENISQITINVLKHLFKATEDPLKIAVGVTSLRPIGNAIIQLKEKYPKKDAQIHVFDSEYSLQIIQSSVAKNVGCAVLIPIKPIN